MFASQHVPLSVHVPITLIHTYARSTFNSLIDINLDIRAGGKETHGEGGARSRVGKISQSAHKPLTYLISFTVSCL